MNEPFSKVPDRVTRSDNNEIVEIEAFRKIKRLKLVITGLVFIIIILLIFIGFLFFSRNSGEEEPKHAYTYETTIDRKKITYYAANLIDKDKKIDSGEFKSTLMDEAVFLVVDGATLTLGKGVKIIKAGEKSDEGDDPEPPEPPPQVKKQNFLIGGMKKVKEGGGGGGEGGDDNYSFYGINSAIVVLGEGSKAVIDGVSITSDSYGANAVVAVNSGEISIKDSTIKTSQDASRGLHATYQGKISADHVSISTKGKSCANLATDRGEGTVTAKNMILSTEGAGSPLIYSIGNITVSNSKGTSTGAQICVIEGKNSAKLKGCQFSCTGKGNRGNVDQAGVMVYQSMSGDADLGVGSFEAIDSNLTILDSDIQKNVPMFFITNTEATVDLKNTTMNFSSGQLMNAQATSEWGKEGENGGKAKFSTINETLYGRVYADDLSFILFNPSEDTVLTDDFYTEGNVNITNSYY